MCVRVGWVYVCMLYTKLVANPSDSLYLFIECACLEYVCAYAYLPYQRTVNLTFFSMGSSLLTLVIEHSESQGY